MIALLSPAKSLDFQSEVPNLPFTLAQFGDEAVTLAKAAAKLGPAKLEKLMRISRKLADLNADRYAQFADQPERAALFAFSGDVYIGFEARSLDEQALIFAQNHVRILSGLYGLLRPLDLIRAYRLEMGTRWAPGRAKTLYQWWGDRISKTVATTLAEEGSDTIINLASKEYWHVVEQAPPKGVRVITVDFREMGPKGPRFNSFGAKRARGMMARWMCEHGVGDAEGLKGFDSDGYRFVADESDAALWRFMRG